jgi:hypothetical protein
MRKREKEAKLLIDSLIKLMITAEKEQKKGNLINGHHKKQYVMDEMRKMLNWEDSIIDEILLLVIDALIEVDKGKLKFNEKVKKSLLCCWDN